jgi:tetrahydromethanopterin S-methyltransferase subunit E
MKLMHKLQASTGLDLLPKILKRVVVGVIGGTIVLIGIALLILPGPAFVVIPLGLLILASEFAWARRLLHRAREMIGTARDDRVEDVLAKEKR